jgi:hypothetical protein
MYRELIVHMLVLSGDAKSPNPCPPSFRIDLSMCTMADDIPL